VINKNSILLPKTEKMNKAKILHNIRKMLEEKGIKEVRSAGIKKKRFVDRVRW